MLSGRIGLKIRTFCLQALNLERNAKHSATELVILNDPIHNNEMAFKERERTALRLEGNLLSVIETLLVSGWSIAKTLPVLQPMDVVLEEC